MNKNIKESHSIAWGYAFFGLMWLAILLITVGTAVQHYGFSHTVGALRVTSGVLISLFVLSSVNIIMAIAVWRVLCLSKTKQRIIIGVAIFFAVLAAIQLLQIMTSVFILPEWYSPVNNGFPIVIYTFAYGYFAYSLRQIIRSSNNCVNTDAD